MGYASGVDEVAAAIADPVRRQILEILRERSLPARRIAERFAISRPAVSRHLRVLRECGLVHDTPSGRERHYRLDPTPLTQLSTWLGGFRAEAVTDDASASAWDRRLDALETEVYRARRDRRRSDTDRTENTA